MWWAGPAACPPDLVSRLHKHSLLWWWWWWWVFCNFCYCCGGCFVIFLLLLCFGFCGICWFELGIQLFFCWCFGFGFLWGVLWDLLVWALRFISYGASGSLEAIAERLELAIAGLYRGLHSRVLAICGERGENCFVVVSLSSFFSRTWTRTPCFVSWPSWRRRRRTRTRIRFGSTFSEFVFVGFHSLFFFPRPSFLCCLVVGIKVLNAIRRTPCVLLFSSLVQQKVLVRFLLLWWWWWWCC